MRLTTTQKSFLRAFEESGTIIHAAEAVGINRQNHYQWLGKSELYREAFAESEKRAEDTILNRARELAIQGWEEPVFYQGEECGRMRRFSATLMMFLLKGAFPNKYAERQDVRALVSVASQLPAESVQEVIAAMEAKLDGMAERLQIEAVKPNGKVNGSGD